MPEWHRAICQEHQGGASARFEAFSDSFLVVVLAPTGLRALLQPLQHHLLQHITPHSFSLVHTALILCTLCGSAPVSDSGDNLVIDAEAP